MKRIYSIAVLSLFAVAAMGGVKDKNSTSYKINPAESKIEWNGKKVTGQHNGEIKLQKGSLEVNGDAIKSGSFVVDMNSITCADLTDKETNQKLVNHLKSDDFFGSAKHPTSTLKIKKATKKSGNQYEIRGDLTIKGIPREIVFPATVTKDANKLTAEAEIVVDRSKFDVRYGSGSFFDNLGDNMIYDDFTLNVKLIAENEAL